jgi:hypothetical protein
MNPEEKTPGEFAFEYVHKDGLGRGGFCIWKNRTLEERKNWEDFADAIGTYTYGFHLKRLQKELEEEKAKNDKWL